LPLFFQTTHTGQCGLIHVLFISSLPQHAALSPPLSVTRCGFFEYILVYSTLAVLFHNCCCWLLLKQLRMSDCYCCRNLLAASR
ncbi:unnamed protein product, partial [Hymenolepis diminuta]